MLTHDVADELPRWRDEATALQVDACVIERRVLDENGDPVRVMDPVTLAYTDSWTTVYTGRCRAQRPTASQGQEANAGEYEYGLASVLIQLPHGTTGIKRGDRVTVTDVGDISDADLLNLVATVQAIPTKTHATKRTLICEEVT